MADKTAVDTILVRAGLQAIADFFSESMANTEKIEFWTIIAEKLSKVVQKEPPWSGRYPMSVHNGTISPSRKFANAVNILGAVLDDMPVVLAETKAIQVYVKDGTIKPGSLVMGQSRVCANPSCRVTFVPNVPWRRFCPICSPPGSNNL